MKKLLASLLVIAMLLSGCASNESAKGPTFDEEVDVLVVGSGGAGMTAAIEAKMGGAEKVVIVEKLDALNGLTYFCGGKLSGYETQLAKKYDVHYTADQLYDQIMKKSRYTLNPELTRITAEECGPLIDWLIDVVGVPFEDEVAVELAYGPDRLLHYVKGKSGAGYREPFTNKINELGIDLRFNNKAVKLIGDEEHNEVIGARIETPEGTKTIKADAVVLATGGYGDSEDMIQRMSAETVCLKSMRPDGPSTGDGIVLATEFGAIFHNQEEKFGPRGYDNSKITIGGTIQLDAEGKRFKDEKGHFDVSRTKTRAGMNRVQSDFYWAIEDAKTMESKRNAKALELNKDNLVVADTVAELAEKMGVDAAVLEETFANYNKYCDQGKDEEFDRNPKTLVKLDNAPYYAMKLTSRVGFTSGGIVRNEKGEVIKYNGEIIPGLYVAGEAAEGACADGWTCSHAMTWGRIAGRNAAAYSLSK